MLEEIILRREKREDYKAVEELTREAFFNVNVPGCNEHYLIHKLRDSDCFIPELDYVAIYQGNIIANIVYTHSHIAADDGQNYEVITFGPVSVMPAFQNMGVGSMIIKHTMEIAKNMGYKAVVIYGDPLYYIRFGFITAENYKIRTADNMYHGAHLICELYDGALEGINGRFIDNQVFDIDDNDAEQ